MNSTDIAGYFLMMIRPILSMPDSAMCVPENDDLGVLLNVRVDKADMGRLLGKEGKNVDKFRNVVRIVGLTHKMRVSVKVVED